MSEEEWQFVDLKGLKDRALKDIQAVNGFLAAIKALQ